MMRRGDAAFRLLVNRTLAGLYRSDEMVRIYETWFWWDRPAQQRAGHDVRPQRAAGERAGPWAAAHRGSGPSRTRTRPPASSSDSVPLSLRYAVTARRAPPDSVAPAPSPAPGTPCASCRPASSGGRRPHPALHGPEVLIAGGPAADALRGVEDSVDCAPARTPRPSMSRASHEVPGAPGRSLWARPCDSRRAPPPKRARRAGRSRRRGERLHAEVLLGRRKPAVPNASRMPRLVSKYTCQEPAVLQYAHRENRPGQREL